MGGGEFQIHWQTDSEAVIDHVSLQYHERVHTGENPMYVSSVIKSSLFASPSNIMKGLTMKKNTMSISNVGKKVFT